MPTSKEVYQVQATSLDGVILRLNAALARIADRLDKLEGIRGELETASGTFSGDVSTVGDVLVTDDNGTEIHGLK